MPSAYATIVKRSQRVAFYGIPGTGSTVTFTRMKHFTALTENKNPITYERQYVDKDVQDSDVTGYGTQLEYGFDHYSDDPVLADVAAIQDDEVTGAEREIVVVDLFDETSTTGTFVARKRTYSVIPDTSGDGTDALQYSGNFAAKSSIVKGTATSADGWETCTFTADE